MYISIFLHFLLFGYSSYRLNKDDSPNEKNENKSTPATNTELLSPVTTDKANCPNESVSQVKGDQMMSVAKQQNGKYVL